VPCTCKQRDELTWYSSNGLKVNSYLCSSCTTFHIIAGPRAAKIDEAAGVAFLPSHSQPFNNNLIPAHATHAQVSSPSSPRHSKTDDGLYSHSFSTPPSFPTRVITPSIPSWSNIQTTRSTTTAGHGPTTRLLQPRQCHPCTPQTCHQGQSLLPPSRRADRQCDDTARGEATLELAL
jgi:hypothetical protein